MRLLKALLIDDDVKFCHTFQMLAENTFDLKIVHSGQKGLEFIRNTTPDVVLLDLKLGKGISGMDVLKSIKKKNSDIPVIMITDFADVNTAVEAMKMGALHYTSKSPNINALKLIIERQLEQINWKLLYHESRTEKFDVMIANSPIMESIIQDIEQVSKTKSTVLIEGESGTGKEVTAREIHRRSLRKDKPFISINCSTLSPQLFESEFFGHEKGAFTGAQNQKRGKLELAHTGTIFLDEIGDLPFQSQAKILRAIEDKSFRRLGGTKTHHVDVRIIVATNKNLQNLVNENLFREDLFYRLSVISLKIPSLRERREDIPLLVELFLKRFAFEMKKKKLELTQAALTKLQNHHWQGNIRELKNFIERLVVLNSEKELIDAKDIMLESRDERLNFPSYLFEQPFEQAKQKLLEDFKRIYLERALQKNLGNITATASEIGINRSNLHKFIRELGLTK